ncbi:hypothetical protein FRC08_005216 [Ceratobasidium sp. 394]|nr:hypothetical protein FRC08_005216 [Ceratobasidium sp. 394]
MEVLNQWLAAKLHLEDAVSRFFDACTKLRSTGSQAVVSYPNQISLEDMLHQVQSQIDSIIVTEKRLHESRAVLSGLLNTSTLRVPIHRLPPETLSRIFSIAVSSTPCCPKGTKRDALLDIPLVCVRWRQIATNNRSLWTHVDIDVGFSTPKSACRPTFNRTRRWLELSRGRTIHLHFSEKDPFERDELIAELVSILSPYVEFFGSINISGRDSSPWAKALLALYSSHSEPIPLRTLKISRIRESSRDYTISWPIKPLQALVYLELDGLRKFASPSLDEVVTMLSNCPALEILRLRYLNIRDSHDRNPSIIPLPHLTFLDLAARDEAGLPFLLPMLSPGTHKLLVWLELDYDDDNEPSPYVQSLLARSNVTSLAIRRAHRARNVQRTSYLHSVQRLRALYLDLEECGSAYILDELIPPTPHDSIPFVPCLETLCIANGDVDSVVMHRVEQVLAARNIKTLGFLSCFFPQEWPDDHQEEDTASEEYVRQMPESMRERLSQRVQNVTVCGTPLARVGQSIELPSYK